MGTFHSSDMRPSTGSPYLIFLKYNVKAQTLDFSRTFQALFSTSGDTFILDVRNNIVILGNMLQGGYNSLFMTKLYPNMKDWDCFNQASLETKITTASLTSDYYPENFDTYDDLPSDALYNPTTLTLTSYASNLSN